MIEAVINQPVERTSEGRGLREFAQGPGTGKKFASAQNETNDRREPRA
jgi:hypothetical protein